MLNDDRIWNTTLSRRVAKKLHLKTTCSFSCHLCRTPSRNKKGMLRNFRSIAQRYDQSTHGQHWVGCSRSLLWVGCSRVRFDRELVRFWSQKEKENKKELVMSKSGKKKNSKNKTKLSIIFQSLFRKVSNKANMSSNTKNKKTFAV